MLKIATLILQHPDGRILAYLRDNKPTIPFPHHWDLFGGHVDPGETVEEALVRELKEELGMELTEYEFLGTFPCPEGDSVPNVKYVFKASITAELNELTLYEGEKLAYFTPEEILDQKFSSSLGAVLKSYLEGIDTPVPQLAQVHHIAIITRDYARSKDFYTRILGLPIVAETYREARDSWKLDLKVGDRYQIELFSFPDRPARPSYPEAAGLRHLAFEVEDLEAAALSLKAQGVVVEAIRTDALTGKRFTFFADPDELPLELYER